MSNFDEMVDEGGTVSVTQERKPFPIPAQGTHNAVCSKALVQESSSEKHGDTLSVKLHWNLETTYKDDQGETRNFMAFSSFGLAYSPKARLYKAVMQLTGKPPVFKQREEKRGGKTYVTKDFVYKQFEGMKCQVVIEHNPSKDGTRTFANIASYLCSPDQQLANLALTPFVPEGNTGFAPDAEGSVRAKMTAKEEPEAEKEVETPADPNPTTRDMVMEKIRHATTKNELESIHVMLIDGSEFEKDAEVSVLFDTIHAKLPD